MTDAQNIPEAPKGFFKSAFDFKPARAPLAAFGFYIFHLIAAGIITVALVLVARPSDQEAAYRIARHAGALVGFFYSIGIYAAILTARKLWRRSWYLCGLLGVVLLGGFSAALGLIPSAIVIARKPRELP